MKRKQVSIDDRVIRILTLASEIVFITPEMIRPRVFPDDTTGESCMRRLRQLAGARLLHQTELPYSSGRSRGGRPPVAYYLTPRGAQLLTSITGRAQLRYLRSEPSPRTLFHRIGYASVLLRLREAATKFGLPSMQIQLEYDFNPGVPPDAPMPQRLKLYEQFRGDHGSTATCWPDASCWLHIPAHRRDLVFYLEYDRGYDPDTGTDSETIGEVAAKLPGYHQLIKAAACKRHWPYCIDPNPIVRVLFVTTAGEARVAHLADAIRGKPVSDAWRLATEASILAPDFSLTQPIWWTTKPGERLGILRSPAAATQATTRAGPVPSASSTPAPARSQHGV